MSDTFTGPTLWNVLQGAGGITVNPANKNDILRQYVIATGADGYRVAISAGEISPTFGNRQDLVATSDTLNELPTPNGFARVVATGDVQGGRYVSNLTNLSVRPHRRSKAQAVPEPTTWLLLAAAMAGLGLLRARQPASARCRQPN